MVDDELKIDPWGSTSIVEEDYSRLIKEFGIEPISESLRQKFIKKGNCNDKL